MHADLSIPGRSPLSGVRPNRTELLKNPLLDILNEQIFDRNDFVAYVRGPCRRTRRSDCIAHSFAGGFTQSQDGGS